MKMMNKYIPFNCLPLKLQSLKWKSPLQKYNWSTYTCIINALQPSYKADISDMKFRLCGLYAYGQYKFYSVFNICLLYVIYMRIVDI